MNAIIAMEWPSRRYFLITYQNKQQSYPFFSDLKLEFCDWYLSDENKI